VFSGMAFHAAAETSPPSPRLELTAANLAAVVDPLMAAWIDTHKGPGAVVVVVRDDRVVIRAFLHGARDFSKWRREQAPEL